MNPVRIMMNQVMTRARKNKTRSANRRRLVCACVLMIVYFYHHKCIFFNSKYLHHSTHIHFIGKKGQAGKAKKGKESSDDDDGSNENGSGDESSDDESKEKQDKKRKQKKTGMCLSVDDCVFLPPQVHFFQFKIFAPFTSYIFSREERTNM